MMMAFAVGVLHMYFRKKPESAYVPFGRLWVKGKGFLKNLKWLALELVFSKQIIEILTNTASIADEKKLGALGELSGGNQAPSIGLIGGLEQFMPANYFGRKAERQLAEMMYEKYFMQYGFIYNCRTNVYPEGSDQPGSEVLYRFNKEKAVQLTVYLGQLDAVFLAFESVSMTISWFASNHIALAVATAAVLEIFRRFKP